MVSKRYGAILMDFKYYVPSYDDLEPHEFADRVISDKRVTLDEKCIFKWPDVYYDIEHYPTHRLEVHQGPAGDLSLVMRMTLFDGFSSKKEQVKTREVLSNLSLELKEYLQYGHDVYLSLLY